MGIGAELLRELTAACREDPRAAELLAAELAPYLAADNGAGEWLDTSAAAAYLGVHAVTVRALARSGELRSAQPHGAGSRRAYRRADLDRYREGRGG